MSPRDALGAVAHLARYAWCAMVYRPSRDEAEALREMERQIEARSHARRDDGKGVWRQL